MLWSIAVILVIMWLLGMVTSYTMGGFLHLLPGAGGYRRPDPNHPGPQSDLRRSSLGWEPAEWDGKAWQVIGIADVYQDDEIPEIGPPIEQPPLN
jgi:hypothetical protein